MEAAEKKRLREEAEKECTENQKKHMDEKEKSFCYIESPSLYDEYSLMNTNQRIEQNAEINMTNSMYQGPEDIFSGAQTTFTNLMKQIINFSDTNYVRYEGGFDSMNYTGLLNAPTNFERLMYEQESGLFDFRRTENSSLLLVIDRRDDPVTPLLNQWTYQAMVHELIGIENNKVDLRGFANIPKDQQEVVLSSVQDDFFRANMFENFGDLGMNIKRMVDDFQHLSKSSQNLQSIGDMAKFVSNYPEYRKTHGNVTKHVALVSEMSRIVEERKLMQVSQTEQELACTSGQATAFEAVTSLLNNENVSDIDRLRLVMLYALRYEKESPVQLMQLFNKLASRSAKYKSRLVQFLLKQAGVDMRTGDLYGNRDLLNIARNMARGLKGVENVYTQHQPLLFQTMEGIVKGRLRDADYPLIGNHFQQGRPQDVVIFIVGGTTYEEARSVALYNAANPGVRFIIGGSVVLNSKRFLEDLREAQRISKSSTLV